MKIDPRITLLAGLMSVTPGAEAGGLSPSTPDAAAGTTLDPAVYRRAEALLGRNLVPTVRNVFMTPHWLPGTPDLFWYRREVDGGHEDVVVDAASGLRRTDFDTAELAREVALVYGNSARAPAETGLLKSPNGQLAVESREGNLWVVNLLDHSERRLTSDGDPVAGYGIAPDNWMANVIPRERAGAASPPMETYWAPNSRTVLVPYIDQGHVAPYPYIESAPADGSFRPKLHPIRIPLVGEHPSTFEWMLIDTETGAKHRVDLPYQALLTLQQDMTAYREISWSQDAKHLYLVAHGGNMESAYVFDVSTSSGSSRTVLEEHLAPRADLNSTSYNPVNVRVVRNGRELIWFSQRDGWGHLYRYDMRDGKLLNRITDGAWLVRDIIDVDEARGIIYFTGAGREGGDPYFRYLYRVNFDGRDLRLLSPEPADHLLLPNRHFVLSLDGMSSYAPVSPSGRYVVYNYSRIELPTRLVIRRVADASLVGEIDQADAAALYAAGWRPPESFTVKAADGKSDLWGTIYRPSDFDARKRYPIIDAQYASPLTAVVPHNFYQAFRGIQPLAPSSYAELGFIVVSVDARGTTYRSREFSQARYGELNRAGLDDHIAAIRALAQTRPYFDLDRVGVVGHSYGGFAALRAMLEFPEFFKVGISSAAMVDTQGMYADYHWSAFQGRPRYGDGTEWRPSPADIPDNWQSLNASGMAEKLTGKLLLQMGELDENVPPGQILQFVDALIKANKDFELMYLPNRDHQFIGEGYVVRRDWDFMVRHLLGRQPPPGYRIQVNGR
jgi:dipeptidyl-peptidase 4